LRPAAPRRIVVAVQDLYGHLISYLRVSITDRCNERCVYCMPRELQEWLPHADILSYEEIARIVRVGASLGVTKLRITGGEPLTRRGVLDLFDLLEPIGGIEDIGVSTNGSLLSRPVPGGGGRTMARSLRDRGVRTVGPSTRAPPDAITCRRRSQGSRRRGRPDSAPTRSSSTAC
jgi:cyclic pyranopterin phosphate synthase